MQKALSSKFKKLRIFDFDDTLVKTNSFIKIKRANGVIEKLTPAEYAQYKIKKQDNLDFSDFVNVNDPQIIEWTFKILRNVIRKEGDVIVLTARSSEANRAINDFFVENGINNLEIVTLGTSDPAAKANYAVKMIEDKGYNFVEFFDDSIKNVIAMKEKINLLYPEVTIRVHHITHRISELLLRSLISEIVK